MAHLASWTSVPASLALVLFVGFHPLRAADTSILELRDQVSTLPDVIRAQLDVKLEEQKRDDAIRRTKACRAGLDETVGQGGT